MSIIHAQAVINRMFEPRRRQLAKQAEARRAWEAKEAHKLELLYNKRVKVLISVPRVCRCLSFVKRFNGSSVLLMLVLVRLALIVVGACLLLLFC